uniref:Uncharacterized protein n=1 Tax=Moniliophthora roreri TaxID=221103 RepID=A0A0W0FID7_MONRR
MICLGPQYQEPIHLFVVLKIQHFYH